ncbi:MAG: exosortase-associated EpsI family protein [Verrucomicrobiales bacterium]
MVDIFTSSRSLLMRPLVVLSMAAITVVFCLNSPATSKGDNAGVTMELPERVLSYEGTPRDVSEAEKKILPADTEFAKMVYLDDGGPAESLFTSIVLSASERRSLHRPEVCLPAQGWTINSSQVVPVEMDGGRDLRVTKLGLSSEREIRPGEVALVEAIYVYWYVGKDVTTPSTLDRILRTSIDNVFRNVNHRWAYVSVMALIPGSVDASGRGEEATMQAIADFVREAVPEFQRVR